MREAGRIMAGSWRWLSIAVAVVAAAPGSVWGMGKESVHRAADLVVTVDSRWCGTACGGYYPIRARIENRGPERTLTLRFSGRGEPLPRVQRSITVPQNGTAQVTLSVPCVSTGTYGEFQVVHDGRAIDGLTETVPLADALTYGQPRPALLVISQSTVDCEPFENGMSALLTTGATYGYSSGVSSDHEVVRPGMLPESWIDYTGVDLVAVSLPTLESLREGERTALLKWVHAGGTLIVFGVGGAAAESDALTRVLDLERHAAVGREWKPGNVAERRIVTYDDSSGTTTLVEGRGVVDGDAQAAWPAEAFASRSLMLGKVFAFAGDPFPGTPHDWAWLGTAASLDRLLWVKRNGMSARVPNGEFLQFLIPSVKGVPVGAFLVLITLFTVVIGPLNYMYLWKRSRLYLLVVTIPLTAFATSLALFAYSAMAHGFATKARVRSLTLLDQRANTAVTTSRLSLYSGIAPSGGLRFGPETAVFPIWPPSEGFSSGVVDWSETQRLESGWLRSRTRTQFLTVSHRGQRGRLEVTGSGGAVTAANGLEWDIAALVVRDGAGRTLYATQVPAGGSAQLVPITLDQRKDFATLLLQHAPRLPDYLADHGGRPAFFLGDYDTSNITMTFADSLMERNLKALEGVRSPDYAMAHSSYVAILAENPDVEVGVEGAREEAGVHVVVGHW